MLTRDKHLSFADIHKIDIEPVNSDDIFTIISVSSNSSSNTEGFNCGGDSCGGDACGPSCGGSCGGE